MPSGKLVHVEDRPIGTAAAADVAAGQTVLDVDWAARFPPAGGTVDIAGVDYGYLSADHEANTLTLATPLSVDVDAGEQVTLLNGGDQLAARDGWVILPGAGEPVIVAVPYALQPLVPVGHEGHTYADPWPVVVDTQLTQLVDVTYRPAQLDLSGLDPTTLPPGSTLTDGVPPASSPQPTVAGGIGALFVSWAAVTNVDPVTYEVHLSTVDDFEPNASTLIATTGSTLAAIRTQPDDVTPLVYGTTYYVKIVARDVDGSAAPSLQGTGTTKQVTGPDVAADYVYAGNVLATQIVSGSLSATVALLGKIQTAAPGGRNVLISTADGLQVVDQTGAVVASIPTDSALDIVFTMSLIARSITATGPIAMRSAGNELARDAALSLRSQTSPPVTAPVPTIVYGSTTLDQPSGGVAGDSLRGGWHDGVRMWVTDANRALAWNTSTGAHTSWALNGPAFTAGTVIDTGGVVKIGSSWYAAVLVTTNDGYYHWMAYAFDDATKTHQTSVELQAVPFFEYYNLGPRKLALGTDGTHLVVVRSKPASSIRLNTQVNGSFEGGQGTTQWQYSTAGTRWSAAFSGALAPGGAYSLLFHFAGFSGVGFAPSQTLDSPYAAVPQPGQNYYGAVSYQINRAGTETTNPKMAVYVRLIDTAGNLQTETQVFTAGPTGNTRTAYNIATFENTAYIQHRFVFTTGSRSNAVNSSDFIIDGLQVELNNAGDQGYFDANFPDDATTHYQWGGNQNLSPSYRVVNDHQAEVATFNTDGSAAAAPITLTTSSGGVFSWGRIFSLLSTAADLGATKLIVGSESVAVMGATSGAEQPDNAFSLAVPGSPGPICWDGSNSRFASLTSSDGTVRLAYYSANTWDSSTTSTWSVTTTWRKGSTYETVQGPPASLSMKKRAFLQVAAPPIPVNPSNADAPDSVSVYVGRGGGTRATQVRQATPNAGVASLTLPPLQVFTTDASHPNPPATGTFPTGNPGRIVSDASDGNGPLLQFRGDGSYRLAGKDLDDPGWVAPDALQNGWINFGGSDAPVSYRRMNGWVTIRGTVKSGSDGLLFNLPEGFRPAYPRWWVQRTSGGINGHVVGSNGDVIIAAGSGTNAFVTVDCPPFIAEQ